MKLWLTLSAALLIPAAANAAEYGNTNRIQSEIQELNARIEKLELDLVKARKVRSGIQVASLQAPPKQTPAKPRPRLNPNLVRMQAIPRDDLATTTTAFAPSNVPVTVTLPEITVSARLELSPTIDEDIIAADAAVQSTETENTENLDDFDPEASEDPLIRLDPETGRPIQVAPTPSAEPVTPKTECTDKASCAKAPLDKQAMAMPKKARFLQRASTRISWR